MDGSDVPRKATAATVVFDICSVELHFAEVLHHVTGVQVSSCK
jgi:hypothetical protein